MVGRWSISCWVPAAYFKHQLFQCPPEGHSQRVDPRDSDTWVRCDRGWRLFANEKKQLKEWALFWWFIYFPQVPPATESPENVCWCELFKYNGISDSSLDCPDVSLANDSCSLWSTAGHRGNWKVRQRDRRNGFDVGFQKITGEWIAKALLFFGGILWSHRLGSGMDWEYRYGLIPLPPFVGVDDWWWWGRRRWWWWWRWWRWWRWRRWWWWWWSFWWSRWWSWYHHEDYNGNDDEKYGYYRFLWQVALAMSQMLLTCRPNLPYLFFGGRVLLAWQDMVYLISVVQKENWRATCFVAWWSFQLQYAAQTSQTNTPFTMS